jgi:hypothetical protein
MSEYTIDLCLGWELQLPKLSMTGNMAGAVLGVNPTTGVALVQFTEVVSPGSFIVHPAVWYQGCFIPFLQGGSDTQTN